jgi:hypothetical protein
MLWARLLAYVTGTVNQELPLRNEYLAAENRILRGQIEGRLLLLLIPNSHSSLHHSVRTFPLTLTALVDYFYFQHCSYNSGHLESGYQTEALLLP